MKNEPDYWPGEVGFLLLEYIGESETIREWPGPVTGIRYPFGPGGVGLVDKRDALQFLAPAGGGKAFRLCRRNQ